MRSIQAAITIVCGLVIAAVGAWWTVEMVVRPSWPSWVPLALVFYGLLWVGVGVWARRADSSWPARYVAVWSLPLIAAGFVLWHGLTGVETRVTHRMTWSSGEPPQDDHGSRHVVLTFDEFPDHSIGIYSSDVADYLESITASEVEVGFAVVRDFGQVSGWRVVRIGSLDHWRATGGYGGFSGSGRPTTSPWDGR